METDIANKDRELLEKQISNIEVKQYQIQNHISIVELNIKTLESELSGENSKITIDYKKIKNAQINLNYNIQLVAQLYDIYKKYEDIKFSYYKQITDLSFKFKNLYDSRKTDTADIVNIMRSVTESLKSSKDKSSKDDILLEDVEYSL